jgi:hypothetical protein
MCVKMYLQAAYAKCMRSAYTAKCCDPLYAIAPTVLLFTQALMTHTTAALYTHDRSRYDHRAPSSGSRIVRPLVISVSRLCRLCMIRCATSSAMPAPAVKQATASAQAPPVLTPLLRLRALLLLAH